MERNKMAAIILVRHLAKPPPDGCGGSILVEDVAMVVYILLLCESETRSDDGDDVGGRKSKLASDTRSLRLSAFTSVRV